MPALVALETADVKLGAECVDGEKGEKALRAGSEVVVLMGAGPRRGACCSGLRGGLVLRRVCAELLGFVLASGYGLIDTLEAATV